MFVRLPWSSLVDPVTSLARGGFSVTKSMGKSEWNCTFDFCGREFFSKVVLSMGRFLWHLDDLFKSGKLKTSDLSPHLQKYFVKDGSFVKLGMKITRPDMADILQEISEKGSLALYNGKYTKEITDVVSVDSTVLCEWDSLSSLDITLAFILQLILLFINDWCFYLPLIFTFYQLAVDSNYKADFSFHLIKWVFFFVFFYSLYLGSSNGWQQLTLNSMKSSTGMSSRPHIMVWSGTLVYRLYLIYYRQLKWFTIQLL